LRDDPSIPPGIDFLFTSCITIHEVLEVTRLAYGQASIPPGIDFLSHEVRQTTSLGLRPSSLREAIFSSIYISGANINE
jgi:hypothetical protein